VTSLNVGAVPVPVQTFWDGQSCCGIDSVPLEPLVGGVTGILEFANVGYIDLLFSYSSPEPLSRYTFDLTVKNESGFNWYTGFTSDPLFKGLLRLTATAPVVYVSAAAAELFPPYDLTWSASSNEGGLLLAGHSHSWANGIMANGSSRVFSSILGFPAGDYLVNVRFEAAPAPNAVPEPTTPTLLLTALAFLKTRWRKRA
jgi:hypothetical protein